MPDVPVYVAILFYLTTLAALYWLWKATNQSTLVLILVSAWLIGQWFVTQSGFYQVYHTLPPRFALIIMPPTITVLLLFALPAGRRWIDSLNLPTLVILHTVRIPVEICLYWLFLHQAIPEIMTFEGGNWDIVSGLTAPFIYWYGYRRPKLSNSILLAWHIACVLLLINVVVRGILSAPSAFQQFAFDRPNVAIFFTPYSWLPAFIVPLVLLAHLVAIRSLILPKNSGKN